jgi:hypothetical protein
MSIYSLIDELIEATRAVCHAPEDALTEPCARMEAARVAIVDHCGEWVKDRLPDNGVTVIMHLKGCTEAGYCTFGVWYFYDDRKVKGDILGWRPLPQPPDVRIVE